MNRNSMQKHDDASTSEKRSYWLPPHVFVCQTRDCVVFLNAHNDKYLGVGGEDGQALENLLAPTPAPADIDCVSAAVSSQPTELLDGLVAHGLLTLDPTSGKPFRLAELQPGSSSIGPGTEYEYSPRLTHVFWALVAVIGARLDLRFRGVPDVVMRLLASKRTQQTTDASAVDELLRLVSVYRVIRPFLYTKKDQCLLHGLALHKFLRRYGLHPSWIIGVETTPFTAHCWVQYDGSVLDDTPEHTLEFTPVLVI